DVLRELFNFGTTRASQALSQLLHDDVRLSVPRVARVTPRQLPGCVVESFDEGLAYVRQPFNGQASGTACVLFTTRNGIGIINAILEQHTEAAQATLSSVDADLLQEVGSILVNAMVGALAESLGLAFRFGLPVCRVAEPLAVCGELQIDPARAVLYVETLFVMPGRNLGGTLVLLLESANLDPLLGQLEARGR
ncbi:MAG TPA: hypothetical protein VFH51_10005, partial [Myxococcota bacterium]|nr:hypothetical protein [Myxococcota bacterium]